MDEGRESFSSDPEIPFLIKALTSRMSSFIRTFLFLLFLLPTGTSLLFAQSNSEVSRQLWLDYNPSFYITVPTLQAFGDVGLRKEGGGTEWWRIVVRPGVKYALGSGFFLAGGVGSFLTINEGTDDRWEIRPFQAVATQWPRGNIAVDHYVRLEERFEFNTADWSSDISVRGRYQLGVSFKWGQVQDGRYWKVLIELEGFVVLTGTQGQFAEQFRLGVGIERTFKWGIRLRGEVTWQKEDAFFFGDEQVSAIYFRFRFYDSL